ncbi:hypothetical protein GS506_17095 [Rhodococcus hoagii]|nr:hypothetical protein [Prescottella equi]
MADAGALPRPSGLTLRTTEVPARRRAPHGRIRAGPCRVEHHLPGDQAFGMNAFSGSEADQS